MSYAVSAATMFFKCTIKLHVMVSNIDRTGMKKKFESRISWRWVNFNITDFVETWERVFIFKNSFLEERSKYLFYP